MYFVYPRRYSSSNHLPQPIHLQNTHGTLSLTPSLLFIRPQTNQRPQPRPKAQYIILGHYPYTLSIVSEIVQNTIFTFTLDGEEPKKYLFVTIMNKKILMCFIIYFR